MLRTLAILLALSSVGAARAEELVPLKIELPKPLFVGTPRPIKVSNLEPEQAANAGPLMVPAGTALLSLNKPVASSDTSPVIGELTCVTDGDKSGDEGSYVAVWHFHAQARVYHAVVVQASNDPQFKTGVTTLFNNDDTNSDGLGNGSDYAYVETYKGKIIDAKGVTARFVRLYSNGNTSDELNHYTEVEVYGKPVN
jgi:hypothetical protein